MRRVPPPCGGGVHQPLPSLLGAAWEGLRVCQWLPAAAHQQLYAPPRPLPPLRGRAGSLCVRTAASVRAVAVVSVHRPLRALLGGGGRVQVPVGLPAARHIGVLIAAAAAADASAAGQGGAAAAFVPASG